jgi:hypothetical protein
LPWFFLTVTEGRQSPILVRFSFAASCLAQLLYHDGWFEIADPFRRPSALLATVFFSVGSLKDKINFCIEAKINQESIKGIFCKQKVKFRAIESYGFSSK